MVGFLNIRKWIFEILTLCAWKRPSQNTTDPNIDKPLILSLCFSVTTKEGQSAAEQLGCMFFEVSAAENYDNVQEALNVVFRRVALHKKYLRQEKEKRKNTNPQIEKKKQKFGNSLFNWKNEKKRSPRRADTL